ncbi:MAG TPA: CRISPR-associated protein Cas4 [Ktedonobacteraceae bacterium]|nr:CRISPR-associated protein Cas4 [Ktedonobacteraceae bacterium]
MHNFLLALGLISFIAAGVLVILLWNERRIRHERLLSDHKRVLGLPEGKLVYEDADGLGETLSSSEYPLAGKPDYVVQLPDGRPVPIELKLSVHDATAPYSNHQVQVAAYCLILEDYFAQAPTHGILRYADREFTIEYTPAMRKKVIRLLSQMAHCSEQEPPPLARQRPAKCRICTFQPICPVGRDKK